MLVSQFARVRFRRRLRLVLVTLLGAGSVCTFTGCVTQILANRLVSAPNLGGIPRPYNDPELLAKVDAAAVATWKTKVGPPDAEIGVSVFDPGDFKLKWDVVETEKDGKGILDFQMNWVYPEKTDHALAAEPIGTLVFLHGIMMTRESMLPWALYFAEKNYRVVLVDLRGHGRSTGRRIGFGTWEADDLIQVTNELERRGLLAGKLGVFGISYGAAMGLQWAARDKRVATVIAVTPYADPRAAIIGFARGFDPGGAGKLSGATFATAEARAEKIAGIHWNELSIVDAVRRMKVPVLFVHGLQDTWIVPENTQTLYESAPHGSQRVTSSKDNHISIQLRKDVIGPMASEWFALQLREQSPPAATASATAVSGKSP